MATYNKFQSYVEAEAEKAHNLAADTFFIQLMNTTPSSSLDAVETDLPADLGTGSGYTAGGLSAGTSTSSAQTAGVYKLTIADLLITSSGTIGPFQFVVLLNNTATNKELIGWFDYGGPITLNNAETFTVDFDGTNGVLTKT